MKVHHGIKSLRKGLFKHILPKGKYDLFCIVLFITFCCIFLFLNLIINEARTVPVTSIIADASFFTLLLIFFKGKLRLFSLIFTPLISLLAVINAVYFVYFNDLIPPSLYFFREGINEASIGAFKSGFRWYYILPVLISFTPLIYAFVISFKTFFKEKMNMIYGIIIAGIFVLSSSKIIIQSYHFEREEYNISSLKDFFKKNITSSNENLAYTFENLKFTGYLVRCVVDLNKSSYVELSQEQIDNIKKYLSNKTVYNGITRVSDSHPSKNLIFIVVESLPYAVVEKDNFKIAAPYLFKLINDENNVTLKAKSLVGLGNSSDAQLMYLTGLLPLRNEPFVTKYAFNNFPSLAKLYVNSIEIIGEKKFIWNHQITNQSFGFSELHSDIANFGIMNQDSLIFAKSKKILKDVKEPFFTFITTLSMHEGYETRGVIYNDKIKDLKVMNNDEMEYYQRLNHLDRNLEYFIAYLKDSGLFDNSIIVIAGDHQLLEKNELRDFHLPYVPVIILNSDTQPPLSTDISQIDVFPSILYLLGVDYKYNGIEYSGLGNNIFKIPSDSVTKRDYDISSLIIRGNW